MKDTNTILKEDRVASTIHNINRFIRMATNQSKTAKCKSDYFVMSGDCVEKIIDKYQNRAAKSALVVDDLGMQVINRLIQEGVKEITLALARVPAQYFSFVKNVLVKTFPDMKVAIITLEETKGMNVDLLISNPAYGKIGADITDMLRTTVTYKEFINLLPANDYKRGTSKETFKYARDMEPVNNGFEGDAAVTTHLARIVKEANDMTLDEFDLAQYKDTSLLKYFSGNMARPMTVKIVADLNIKSRKQLDRTTTAILGWRDIAHQHLPYAKTVPTYLWNKEESIDTNYLYDNTKANSSGVLFFSVFYFKTMIEKKNFVKFIYSLNGFRFISKLFTAMNVDGGVYFDKLPKVDWTRSWTVEEILADYGYTEAEIKEVMNDLDNFKDMDRD